MAASGVLADLARLGPFFAVSSHRPDAGPEAPWRPLGELAGRPGPLLGRIGSVRAALAERAGCPVEAIESRVAASVTHLGLAARLIAPSLAAAVAGHWLDMRPGGLWWQDTLGGPVPLSVPEPAGPSPEGESDGLLDELIAPLTAATSALIPVSPRVLWGNVAAAVNGGAAQLAAQRPDLSGRAWAVASAFFASPLLGRERRPPGPAYRRSSCCLIYRLTPRTRQLCGDCVLAG